jgi:hypothetical protein
MINPYSEQQRIEAIVAASYAAVAESFPHLAVHHIIVPPHTWFDAALARQIVVHILNVEFRIPRRRICTLMGRQRTSISFACQRIRERRRDPVFAAACAKMSARAKSIFLCNLHKAAA